jgi:hypothetical protein
VYGSVSVSNCRLVDLAVLEKHVLNMKAIKFQICRLKIKTCNTLCNNHICPSMHFFIMSVTKSGRAVLVLLLHLVSAIYTLLQSVVTGTVHDGVLFGFAI